MLTGKGYLVFQILLLEELFVIISLEFVKADSQGVVVPFQLLVLEPSSTVLKPYCNLARLQAEFFSKLHLPLWFKLILRLKALLKKLDLSSCKPPFLFIS